MQAISETYKRFSLGFATVQEPLCSAIVLYINHSLLRNDISRWISGYCSENDRIIAYLISQYQLLARTVVRLHALLMHIVYYSLLKVSAATKIE